MSKGEKLPIYPQEQPEIILVESHLPFESQIATGRIATTGVFNDVRDSILGVVSKWVKFERGVEREIKRVLPEDEDLLPGAIYVGVATLSGSILARNRVLLRLTLPPALFLTSLNQFLPKTATNLSKEVDTLTAKYTPSLHTATHEGLASFRSTYKDSLNTLGDGKKYLEKSVSSTVSTLEEQTGLKLRQAFQDQKLPQSEAVQISAIGKPVKEEVVPTYKPTDAAPEAGAISTTISPEPVEVKVVPVYRL